MLPSGGSHDVFGPLSHSRRLGLNHAAGEAAIGTTVGTVAHMASRVQPRDPAPSRGESPVPWCGAHEGLRFRAFHSSMARLLAMAGGT